MHNLAVAYAEGSAGKKNTAEAARWFAKAAALGLSDSQFNLAVLYERGDGVPQSLIDAYKWYSIAAAGGDAESKARIAVLKTQLSDDRPRRGRSRAAQTFRARAAQSHRQCAARAGAISAADFFSPSRRDARLTHRASARTFASSRRGSRLIHPWRAHGNLPAHRGHVGPMDRHSGHGSGRGFPLRPVRRGRRLPADAASGVLRHSLRRRGRHHPQPHHRLIHVRRAGAMEASAPSISRWPG